MTKAVLAHHGIKGMKWGVRRTPEQLARASGRPVKEPAGRDKGSAGAKKPAAASTSSSKKTLGDLSDDELRQRISRLELEKRYKDLEKADVKPKSTRGRDFCVNVGQSVLGEAINKLAGVSSDDKAHRVVNPQKGQEDKK